VLLKELSKKQRKDKALIASCIGGALLKEEYLKIIKQSGFEVKSFSEDKKISDMQYKGFPVESLKLVAIKNKLEVSS